MSKALDTVKIVELTLVIAIETHGQDVSVCAMDYLTAHYDATIIGWSEQPLTVAPKETETTNDND